MDVLCADGKTIIGMYLKIALIKIAVSVHQGMALLMLSPFVIF